MVMPGWSRLEVFRRMNGLRNRLIAVFVLATLLPLGWTLWVTQNLIQRSFDLSPVKELDSLSTALLSTGKELYQQACEALKRDAAAGALPPEHLKLEPAAREEACELSGKNGDRIDYYVRGKEEVLKYSRPMGVAMGQLQKEYHEARDALEQSGAWNVRQGF